MLNTKCTLTGLVLLLVGSAVFADATMNQLLKMRFTGAGKVINIFAGKAAKEGLETTIAISGDRQATKTGRDIEVIDLSEQMIWRYSVNRKGKAKKCKATTFDELREQLASIEQLPFFGNGANTEEAPVEATPLPEFEVTVTLRKRVSRKLMPVSPAMCFNSKRLRIARDCQSMTVAGFLIRRLSLAQNLQVGPKCKTGV